MKKFDIFKKSELDLFEYFGCPNERFELSPEDARESKWLISNGFVFWWDNEEPKDYNGKFYSSEMSDDRVYRRDDYTAIATDTQTSAGWLLSIFSNGNEVENPDVDLMRTLHEDNAWQPR